MNIHESHKSISIPQTWRKGFPVIRFLHNFAFKCSFKFHLEIVSDEFIHVFHLLTTFFLPLIDLWLVIYVIATQLDSTHVRPWNTLGKTSTVFHYQTHITINIMPKKFLHFRFVCAKNYFIFCRRLSNETGIRK